jgi:hypothetical protein
MGRLENIIERNRNPKGNRERIFWGMVFGIAIIAILWLALFTDLGTPPDPKQDPARTIQPTDKRVDDVKVWSPRGASPEKK